MKFDNIIKAVFVIEAVILIGLISAFIFEKSKGLESMDMGINVGDFSSDYITYGDDWYIDQDMVEGEIQSDIDLLYGPFITLPKGHYTLTVQYDCDCGQEIRPYAAGENNAHIVSNHLNVCCKIEIYKVAKPKWTMLHVQKGQKCIIGS